MAGNTSAFLLELYRQAWLANRHTETMRAHFGVFYGAITAGLLGLVVRADVNDRPIYVFLAILSLFATLVSLRSRSRGRAWTRTQKRIQVEKKDELLGMDPENVAPTEGRWERFGDSFRLDEVYPILYLILTIVFAVLAAKPDVLRLLGSE